MKYTKRGTEGQSSRVAVEIRALLARQDSQIENARLAVLMGVSVETVNSVVYRGRVPGIGFINGLARALRLEEAYVGELMAMHANDVLDRKINKMTCLSDNDDVQSIATILGVLDDQQIAVVKKIALKFAIANRISK